MKTAENSNSKVYVLTLNNNQKMGKLLRLFIIPLAAAAIAVGCTKEKEDANIKQDSNNSEAVNVKISVDYPQTSPETKTIIEQNPAGGLRVSWDANEEISLLSFDSDNRLIAVDNLTSTGEKGRRSATFTGKYSKPNGAKGWIIVYPSLAKNKEGNYVMKEKPSCSHIKDSIRCTIFEFNGFSCTTFGNNYSHQVENNDMSHLRQWDIMSAKIENDPASGETKGVTLQKNCAILNLNLTVDPAHRGKKINAVRLMTHVSASYMERSSNNLGWLDKHGDIISFFESPQCMLPNLYLHIGKDNTGVIIPSDGKISAYIPFFVQHSSSNSFILEQGTPIDINLFYIDHDIAKFNTSVCVIMPTNLELLPGKIYTINATLPKENVKATSIAVEKNVVTVKVGESVPVKFTTYPENTSNRGISFYPGRCEFFNTSFSKRRGNEVIVTGEKVGERILEIQSNSNVYVTASVKIKVVAE